MDEPDEFRVYSNCLLYRSRGDDTDPSLFSAQRKDLLRRDGDGWLIVHRWAAIDQSLINAHNMSIFI
jgi:3-phenylpropionate/cinnamic acid dioxygenase small subunit